MDGWPGLQESLLGQDAWNIAVINLGKVRAVGLVFLSLVRIRRAGLDEAVADFSGNE